MIGNYTVNPNYAVPEKFVAEKIAEQIYPKTIDSHRVRLNNPKSILQEINYVLTDFHHNKIKHFDKTVKPVLDEAEKFLKGDNTLKYGKVSMEYYSELLAQVKDINYLQLFYATNLILKENQNYLNSLCDAIQSEIVRLIAIPSPIPMYEFIQLSKFTEYLTTEMVNCGYSKAYLSKTIITGFDDKRAIPFSLVLDKIRALSTRQSESFDVIFRLVKKPGGTQQINMQDPQVLTSAQIGPLEQLNIKATQFFSKKKPYYWYLKITQTGKDFLSVVEKAKRLLLPKMDILHMGFPDTKFYYEEICLVIGANQPNLATTQPIRFISDGYYRTHQGLYENLQESIQRLSADPRIQKETIQKIVSAVRHLRLGSDADELEQIFINYWIGLEYIFSNYDAGESSINRLKDYFINAHSLSYLKRNLIEFFRDIDRLGLQSSIPNCNADLQFLKDQTTYDHIMANYATSHPLLAFRAYYYKSLHQASEKVKDAIKHHRNNLERHLSRCYRVRNEIVHDAAIHLNIESITGNLKYYLTFIVNDIITFLNNNPMDLNLSGNISIDDYFIHQDIRRKSLEKAGLSFNQLIDETSVTEIFT